MPLNWNSLPRPIVALSPMADMTDSAFCRVVKERTQNEKLKTKNLKAPVLSLESSIFSWPIVFREMVSAEAVVRGNDKTLGMTEIHELERPLVQQIFGSDPAVMAEAARIIAAQHHPEGFDVNMGCPVYKIVHNFNGAALMKEPELAAEIVTAMKKAVDVPVSVKIRLGWSDPTECLTFVKVLEQSGADLITIHGRTKVQGYTGTADWNMIGKAKEQVSIPVLANGDIHSAELIPTALAISKCDGVLIARGALGNPWIFKQFLDLEAGRPLHPVTLTERLTVIRRHLDLHLKEYGEDSINTFRKHLSWYFKGQPHFKAFKVAMMTAKNKEDLLEVFSLMLKAK